ncbi:MAG: OsmC family protein [Azospira sp.]|jgi:putative redox protein|nr:OsmC family protein [Azospira sp.]
MSHHASEVVVAENGLGRYQQSVRAGTHLLVADEPAGMGGADAGPAPYDYLLTALGACTSMTLRMYAERKELPLKKVTVTLGHEKVEIEGRGRIDRITRHIALDGELTPEQRERMLEIANRCPVHRTLSGNLEIASSLAPAD